MIRRKKLPTGKHEGVCIVCNKCKKHFFWTQKYLPDENGTSKKVEPICGDSQVKFSNCPDYTRHRFKTRFHIPGSNMARASKTLDVTNYNDAVIQAIQFKKEYTEELFSMQTQTCTHGKAIFLFDVQIAYLNFLDNVDVPEHQKVQRTDKYIKEQAKSLEQFNIALSKKKINKKIIAIHKISDIHVGYFHSYLTDHLSYANKTYNNKMTSLSSFFEWAIDNYDLPLKNPFKKVRRKSTKTKNITITKEEFNNLINPKNMCYENGWVVIGNRTAKRRNVYRDFLSHGIQLCLHTGGRREEVVELRWDMIHEINNIISYIEFNNLKVERMLGDGYNDNVQTNVIPITQDLKELLFKLGYEEHKGSSEFIICPNREKTSTKTIMENLSKGFSHYYDRLNTGKNLQMKCLRKTYLTYLKLAMGNDMRKLDSHSTDEILNKHYIDATVINKAIAEMTIFGK